MSAGDVRVFPTLEDASRGLAEEVASALRRAVEQRGRMAIALSGGSTPRRLYQILAREHSGLPWPRTHVFWGDERWVPRDSADSNYRMARETLLDAVPIPPENVHAVPTHMDRPEDAAASYEGELAGLFGDGPPRFDVMLLGMGEDGHTASLFPHSPALAARDRWVVAAEARAEPVQRITMTLPVTNNARAVHLLVAGATKREPLRCVLVSPEDPERCPAALVHPSDGSLTWWLDEEAAVGLEEATTG